MRQGRLKGLLCVLSLLGTTFLWQSRGGFLPCRRWQAQQRLSHQLDKAHKQLNRELVDAAHEENPDNVRWLLDRGADVNTLDPAWDWRLPVGVSSPSVVEVFLEHGFNVNADGRYGVLYQAAYNGNGPMVAFLLRHGADVNTQGAAALRGAQDGMSEAVERAGLPPPPDGASAGWDEATSEAEARRPYEQVVAALRKAGVHG